MPVRITPPTTEPAVSDDTLSSLVNAIKEDPTVLMAVVKARVAASQSDTNNCMMGGWTA